ncbi:hypothetical protein D3C85_1139150 [compost metagenome]
MLALTALEVTHNSTLRQRPPAPDLPISRLAGKVTRIITSCSDKVLDVDGTIKPGAGHGLCDGGSFVYIDGQSIQTATGNVGIKDSFSISTKSIELGDEVTAYYAIGSRGEKTLHCSDCSIAK